MMQHQGFLPAGAMFMFAGAIWMASVIMGGGDSSPAIGAMFLAVGAMFIALGIQARRKGGAD